MEKEFIPYEQALALKELSFDEPCFGSWEIEKTDTPTYTHSITTSYKNSNHPIGKTAAPLYFQAFRWFREKHKLYHTINMFGDWDKPQYSYLVSGRTMNNPAHMWHFEDKDSHEEAELACLIKLIEIIKNNE